MKKIGKFLASMRFALILLAVLVVVCVLGSVIPQGNIPTSYQQAYPRAHHLILGLKLDDVFHAWWFMVLTAALCLNLLLCNLIHVPLLLSRMKHQSPCPQGEGLPYRAAPRELLRALGFRKEVPFAEAERQGIYASRNQLGHWGAWLTHLGILIIIVGFALGQMLMTKYTVYGVPGQEKQIGDTRYTLKIDDFSITLRDDDTVEQYTSQLTLTDQHTGTSWSGETSVNHPLDLQGMRLYQNSTGWAADVLVYKDDRLIQQELLCAGEYFSLEERPELVVSFRSFYPDYIKGPDGMPATASGNLRNPAYLYALYYHNELLGMNALQQGEKITAGDYSIIFTNPRSYTLIQIKRDPFTWLAGLGGMILMAALVLAFYLPPEEIWLVEQASGYLVYGKSKKGGLLYQEKLKAAVEKSHKEAL